jgi:hypothetical protein
MKTKKALKRLTKVEAILSDVIDQYSGNDRDVRDLLDAAKVSIVRAKDKVNLPASPRGAKKPPVKAKQSQRGRLTAEGRKKLSIAAKKRWAIAKRKGVNAVTGLPLSKTA